jgi:hypothetical protein
MTAPFPASKLVPDLFSCFSSSVNDMCSKYWFTIILFLFTRISANPLDTLKPLLVDLQGWNASPAYGMNSYQKDMKIITASRNYTQVDRQLKAVLVFTDQISKIPWLNERLNFDISGLTVETEEINGFLVFHTSRNSGSEILIVVTIQKTAEDGLFFVLNFKNVTPELAWDVAEKFDWNTIQFLTQNIRNE